jgi:hypothetical protein
MAARDLTETDPAVTRPALVPNDATDIKEE